MKRRWLAALLSLAVTAPLGCDTATPDPAGSSESDVSVPAASAAPVVPSGPTTEPFVGYSLFAPLRATDTYLVNMDKQVVHRWSAELSPGSAVYLLENGDLLRGGREPDNPHFRGGGIGARIQRFDWEGNLVWDFNYATESHCPHHDIEPMRNGNILMIGWEKKTKEEAMAQGRDPDLLADDGLWPDHVVEIKPTGPTTGEIVWEWHMWDHLIQDFDREKPGYGVIYEHPELIDLNNTGSTPPETPEELRRLRSLGYTGGGDADDDRRDRRARADWLHTNAIDYNEELDQIALSAKNFSEIWLIDHSTTTEEAASHKGGRSGRGGDLLYRWGNPWSYKSGTLHDKKLFDQHDVRWIPAGHPGAGHLMAFNNGSGRKYSSVVEIEPPMGEDQEYILNDDGVYGPEEPVWEYAEDPTTDFYAGHISGAVRLPNGNTLICNGETGRFFEVNSVNSKLWEFTQPYGGERDRNGQATDPVKIARETIVKRAADGEPRRFIEEHNALFRAIKFAPDYPAFAGKTLAPLDPQPVPFSAVVAAEVAKLDAEPRSAADKVEPQSDPSSESSEAEEQ